MGGRHAPDGRPDIRRLPPGALARPDRPGRGRRAATADDRRAQRPSPALLARRPLARVHLGSAAAGRGGAGAAERDQGSRGQGPGPPAAARRSRRGAPVDRPAARRRGASSGRPMAAAWSSSRRRMAATHEEDARRRGTRTQAEGRASRPPPTTASSTGSATCSTGPGFQYDQHPPPVAGRRRRRARRRSLTDGPVSDTEPAWSPDGTPDRVRRRTGSATTTSRFRPAIHVVDVAIRRGPRRHAAARDRSSACRPGCPTGGRSRRSATSSRVAAGAGTTSGCSPADGSEAEPTGGRNLSARHDLMPGSGDEQRRHPRRGAAPLAASPDGRSIAFTAPIDGAYELWRIAVADGDVERLTERPALPRRVGRGAPGARRHAPRMAYLRSTPTEPPDLWLHDGGRRAAAA